MQVDLYEIGSKLDFCGVFTYCREDLWEKVESIYKSRIYHIIMGTSIFLKQRNKKMIQNYVQFLKTFLTASLLKYLFLNM